MTPKAYRAPTRDDHQRFYLTEGWTEVVNARAKTTGHHVTCKLLLADGRILRTRVSRPVDRSTYGQSMFQHILREHLECTKDQFFACVDDGVRPPRPQAPTAPKAALPLYVAQQLQHIAGLTELQIAELSLSRALEILAAHYGKPGNDSN